MEKEQWKYMFKGDYICEDYKNRTFQELKRWANGTYKIKSRWIEHGKSKPK